MHDVRLSALLTASRSQPAREGADLRSGRHEAGEPPRLRLDRTAGSGLAALLLVLLAGCSTEPSRLPISIPTARPTPVSPANQLLATLPADAGGLHFGSYRIVDDSFNVGHSVDAVLDEVNKVRADAVAVFRYAQGAGIGAVTVEGIQGDALLSAFVDAWDAPAVIRRRERPAAGTVGWELQNRRGNLTIVYRQGNIVYLVSTQDRDILRAILGDMPQGGE